MHSVLSLDHQVMEQFLLTPLSLMTDPLNERTTCANIAVTPNRKSICASQLQKVVFSESKSLQNTRKRAVYNWLKYV